MATDNKKKKDKGLSSGATLPVDIPVERHDLRILQALRRIIHAVDVQSKKVATTYGVTVPQIICLHKVVEKGPISTSALGKEVFLASSTVIGILDRLEEKGYIIRARDTKDRRLVYGQASTKGRQLVECMPNLIQETLCNAFADLSELELSTITLSLEKIIELMEAGRLQAPPILDSERIFPQ